MSFLTVIAAVFIFLLLLIFCMQIHTFFLFERRKRIFTHILFSKSENKFVQEISSGAIKNFIKEMQGKNLCPKGVKIFLFSGAVIYIFDFQAITTDNFPVFTISTITNPSKSFIFINKDWFNDLDNPLLTEEEVKWILCHEIRHITNFGAKIMGILLLRHIGPKSIREKMFLKEELDADSFASKVLGTETGIRLLEKLKESSAEPQVIEKRIAALKILK